MGRSAAALALPAALAADAGRVTHEGVTSCWLFLVWLARVELPSAPDDRSLGWRRHLERQ